MIESTYSFRILIYEAFLSRAILGLHQISNIFPTILMKGQKYELFWIAIVMLFLHIEAVFKTGVQILQ